MGLFTCSGSRDGSIHYHDVRKPEHCVAKSEYHHLEVCGMKWSTDGKYLASGANDNLVCIWNAKNPQEPHQILRGHQAAVKVSTRCLGWGLWTRLLYVDDLRYFVIENFGSKSFPVPPLPHRLWRGVPGSLACWQQEGAPTTNASRYGTPPTDNVLTL